MVFPALLIAPCLIFIVMAFVSKGYIPPKNDLIVEKPSEGDIDWEQANSGLVGLIGVIKLAPRGSRRAMMKSQDEWLIVENVYSNIPFRKNDIVVVVGVNPYGRFQVQKIHQGLFS